MDRLRVIEVEPDLATWRGYAVQGGLHPAVGSYLALRGEDFYVSDGDRIVTARSWSDLSGMMLAMEALGDLPDAGLVGQYLQVEAVAERFALYLTLCRQHGEGLYDILNGAGGPDIAQMPFEQALFAAQLLSARLGAMAAEWEGARNRARRLQWFMEGAAGPGDDAVDERCARQLERQEKALDARVRAGAIREYELCAERTWLSQLRALCAQVRGLDDAAALETLRRAVDAARAPADQLEKRLIESMKRALGAMDGPGVDPNARYIFLNDLKTHAVANQCLQRHFPGALDRDGE
jgi:hypothetical protein